MWNGNECVSANKCPCFYGLVQYAIGSSFTNEDCDDCQCIPGGSLKCVPKVCAPCDNYDEFTYLTPSCGCLCKKCPSGQRLCPTSKTCIAEDLWCNGVQDCTDDEINCASTTVTPPITTSTCPPDPICPEGARLRQTEIENPIGCIMSKCECDQPTCPDGYDIKYLSQLPENTHKYDANYNKPEKFVLPGYYGSSNVNNYHSESHISSQLHCPKFECIKIGPPPTTHSCFIRGQSLKTFDGATYSWSSCHHILATNASGVWMVTIHKQCSSNEICEKSIQIGHDEVSITLKSDLRAVYNNVAYTTGQAAKLNNIGFKITPIGDSSLLFQSLKYPLWIHWSKTGHVEIRSDSTGHNQITGLCGFFNGDPNDDQIHTHDGTTTVSTSEEFIKAWAIPGAPLCQNKACPLERQRRSLEICNSLKFPPFSNCGDILSPHSQLNECLENTCECLNEHDDDVRTCRCQTQTDYVTQCLRLNRTIDLSQWRIDHFCPGDCPAGKVMRDCHHSPCQSSCGHLHENDECRQDENVNAVCLSRMFLQRRLCPNI